LFSSPKKKSGAERRQTRRPWQASGRGSSRPPCRRP
jgi:hypothetical protein